MLTRLGIMLTGEEGQTFWEKVNEFSNQDAVVAIKFLLVGAVVIAVAVYMIKNRKKLFK